MYEPKNRFIRKARKWSIRQWFALLPRTYKLTFAAFLTSLLVNLPPLRTVMEVSLNHFSYVTRYGQWIEEWQYFGWPYADRLALFKAYRRQPGYKKDSVLYRVDAMNPLKFWRWYDYAIHPRWQLPYNSRPDTLPRNDHSIGAEPRPLPPLP